MGQDAPFSALNSILDVSIDPTPTRPFVLYLCSGPRREGDFAQAVNTISAAQVVVANIDTIINGPTDDISLPQVMDRLRLLAQSDKCIGLLATIPCNTWSAAKFQKPGPPPLRDIDHPSGIPDQDGRLHPKVVKANNIAKHAIELASMVAAQGGCFVFENPVPRDKSSPHYIPGRERHASLWSLPAMVEFAQKHQCQSVDFDQCMTGSATQKTTRLLCSPNIHEAVHRRLGHLKCNHHPSEHKTIIGRAKSDGSYQTKHAEIFSPALNQMLAQSFLETQHSSPMGWLDQCGHSICLHTCHEALQLSSALSLAHSQLKVDVDDPVSLANGIMCLYAELDESDQRSEWPSLQLMAPQVEMLYKVAAAKANTDDNPSFKRAMAGTERQMWMKACEDEIASLERANIFERVREDSLPTWNAHSKRAAEVCEFLWVLKKKYDELGNLLKYKSRATIRGDQEVKADQKLGLPPAQVFAPTMRHNTLKLANAASTVRAAKSIQTGRSPRKIRRRTGDVETAFLHGHTPEDRPRFVRPPMGFREVTRDGCPIVWRVFGNCYGRTIAPRVWNQTLDTFLLSDLALTRSDHDPCYYYKV